MTTGQKIIDGDGHVVEDIATIWKYMPQEYVGKSFSDMRGRSPFPPIDHLHTANRHFTPKGAFANVGREGWELFLEEVGIGATVLYTSAGLAFGKIVSRDWAIELARAYNNWIYDTYLSKSNRFKAMGLIPLQEPAEAVVELAALCGTWVSVAPCCHPPARTWRISVRKNIGPSTARRNDWAAPSPFTAAPTRTC